MVTTFVIEGTIRGKDRPRFNTQTGSIYTTNRTIGYQAWVRDCYMLRGAGRWLEGQIKATIEAHYAVPKRKSKSIRMQMLNGSINPTIKPDADNIAKIILDALNKIAYKDDSQITQLTVIKRYSEQPYVRVTLEEVIL
jgi:Holliday junction resolvase RusA-like endonuclease